MPDTTTTNHVSDHEIRGKTHGDFSQNATTAQQIKDLMRGKHGWDTMALVHRESLDLIATKLARILVGDADFKDHWNDIEGYARLAKDRASK